MPGRKTHVNVGGLAGTGLAAYQSAGQMGTERIYEIVGGYFGGRLGGAWPDILEPGTSSWHRQFAHSITAGGVITAAAHAQLSLAQRWLRDKAAECDQRVAARREGESAILWQLCAVVLRFMAGMIAGVIAGYLSHVALDAFTPRSVPVI